MFVELLKVNKIVNKIGVRFFKGFLNSCGEGKFFLDILFILIIYF